MSDAVKPAPEALDARRVSAGVLIAVVLVIPVKNPQGAIRPGLLRDRHEPLVIGREEIRAGGTRIGTTLAGDLVGIDAAGVDIAHIKPVAVFDGVGIAIKPVDSAVGSFLVLVADDGT